MHTTQRGDGGGRVNRTAGRMADGPVTVRPAADIYRTPDAVEILVDVPGVDRDAVSLTVQENELALEAERGEPAESTVGQARLPIRYRRVFRLSDLVDADQIRAKLDQGVLRLTLPKAERARPRRIPVEEA